MSNAIRDGEIIRRNESRTAYIIYSAWDMGNKYKIYTVRDGVKRFYMALDNLVAATKCLGMIP